MSLISPTATEEMEQSGLQKMKKEDGSEYGGSGSSEKKRASSSSEI